jgi:muramoyltetrapeptide carboxypeptidase
MAGQGHENQSLGIAVLEPSSPSAPGVFEQNLTDIRNRGIRTDVITYDTGAGERLAESGVRERVRMLSSALLESDCDYVMAARGGYGASDLLRHLDWQALAKIPTKIMVGFSDISALHAALYTRLGWPGLHAPMPGSTLWGSGPDVASLLEFLSKGRPWSGRINVQQVSSGEIPAELNGTLLGGCLSVLSNLIGTGYFPGSLSGYVLFFEDTRESAPRILRLWNQWLDSGLLDGVAALVLGRFTELDGDQDEDWLVQALMSRSPCPVFRSPDFGHVAPNMPLVIGSQARISNGELAWLLN